MSSEQNNEDPNLFFQLFTVSDDISYIDRYHLFWLLFVKYYTE